MLTGRVAVVTGSSRGLGRGIAVTLARHGAIVVVNYLTQSAAAEETIGRIVDGGGTAWAFRADVTDPGQVANLVQQVLARHGSLDILVNNVGSFLWRDVLEQTDEEWQRIMNSNLSSAFYCTRAALPVMRGRGWGRIINLGITGGQHTDPAAHMSAYVAAKAGMIAFSRCVALEAAPYGVTVNVVCPGVVPDTERTIAEARAIADREVPVGRPGTWEDVANAVVFLASPQSSFVTGAVLEVNGGWLG